MAFLNHLLCRLQLTLVGVVRKVQDGRTFTSYVIEDGTGQLDLRHFHPTEETIDTDWNDISYDELSTDKSMPSRAYIRV